MKKLDEKTINAKVMEALEAFLAGKTIDKTKYHWEVRPDKRVDEFVLIDHSMYDDWGVVDNTRNELVLDGEEENKVIHLLSIYIDKFTGETFVERVAQKLPWED